MSKASARSRKRPETAPTLPAQPNRWLPVVTLVLAAICLLGIFSTEIADTDFWWHLKTGEFILEHRALPVPDPFAYPQGQPGEAQVRHFNLTHEWLAQLAMYLAYAVAGFPGVILSRAALLATLCGVTGILAFRAAQSPLLATLAALATAAVAYEFLADRPALVSFLLVAIFVAILELRRFLWALPVLMLIWANCHGGFFLGWVVMAAYCTDFRAPDHRRLWLVSACAAAASFINPNGFGVFSTLLLYRQSEMTKALVEWARPSLWGPPYAFDLLLYAAAVTLALTWRKVRVPHWILVAAFAAASLIAFRNILLIGFLAPVLIVTYLPRFRVPRTLEWAAPVLIIAGFTVALAKGDAFQLRAATWPTPTGAANFILANKLSGPLFNTYEQGGYLLSKLAPQTKVFIDGRSLSDSVYRDYNQILFNRSGAADRIDGPRAELMNRYDIRVVVMNSMDYVSGALYPLALALANPASTDWQLAYDDTQDLVFVRGAAPALPVLPDKFRRVLVHLDRECAAYIENSPGTPLCARTLADYWLRNGVKDRARRMLTLYLDHATHTDAQAETLLQQLGSSR